MSDQEDIRTRVSKTGMLEDYFEGAQVLKVRIFRNCKLEKCYKDYSNARSEVCLDRRTIP